MEDTYTFIGATADGATVFMDIAALPSEDDAKHHSRMLLRQHLSGDLVEIWRGDGLITKTPRAAGSGPAA